MFSAVTKYINSAYLINLTHKSRFLFDVGYMASAYALTAIMAIWKSEVAFWLILVSSIMHGSSAAFSESTAYGWIKGFPPRMIGAFSSGTGMSGLGGTLSLLFFKSFKFFRENEGYIFIIMGFLVIPYCFCMLYLH